MVCCLIGFAHAESNEQSFIAPLVKQSLLLGVTSGANDIIVGERGHILVNIKPEKPSITSFTQVLAPTTVTLTEVYSIDNLAWSVGHDATIIKSTDAGITWSVVQSEPDLDRPLLSVYFFDKNEGIAVGAYGLFYRSLDGGSSWLQETHPSMLSDDDNEYLESIKDDEAFYLEELSFISPHLNKLSYKNGLLYVAGEAGLIAVSDDRGLSWRRLDIDYHGSFFDVGFLQADNLQSNITLAVGLRGNIFVLSEKDQVLIPTCITTSLNRVITTPTKTFVVGNNGVVLSVDEGSLNELELGPRSAGACQKHPSVTLIDTDFSDSILSGMLSDDGLILVTAGGLKTVAIEE
jgi:photosystem II stability/assembly factor-like uncharacterized protein